MAIVIESQASNVVNNVSSIAITKPTDTVSGNLLVMTGNFEINTTVTAPSGWTQITNNVHSSNQFRLLSYYKVAGGSEPADYTWSWTNGRTALGMIMRISGFNTTTPIQTSNSAESNTSVAAKSFACGVTPTIADSLLIMLIGERNSAGSSAKTWSNQAIATSNPSWTERLDVSSGAGGGYFHDVAVATATRTQTTDTGNASATLSTTNASNAMGQLIVVNPLVATSPTVTTQAVSAITQTTATGNGTVTSDGGATITERGTVYSLSANPTTADTKDTSAGTTGAFTTSIDTLAPGTLYHVRAYAINSVGTSYGSDVTFTTLGLGMQINIGDVWKTVTKVQVNIGDVWKPVTKIQINIGDVWKTIF